VGKGTRPVTQDVNPAAANFRLSAGDVIDVRFFYNPELNEKVQIRPDGHISLALSGDVDLSNKTIAEATQHLESVYQKFLKTPAVTIQVLSYAAQKVYVGGEVVRPGVVNLPGRMTVLEAVMDTGGVRHTGRSSSVVLIRKGESGTPVVRKISMKNVNNEPSEASLTVLQPYDVILVPESTVARLDRWVDQHIRQMIPATMTAGWSYLQNGTQLAH
jgi:protein involved in polysaccharide export with SLBB domain